MSDIRRAPHTRGDGCVQARVHVDLTEREARSLVRAAELVTDVLRPELFNRDRPGAESPLVTACQVLIGACERAGVELGAQARPSE
jgi:hypothetical protein